MNRSPADFRTPLARVEGLGAARAGTHHFLSQRISAVALAPLSIWFVYSALGLVGANLAEVLVYLSEPLNAILLGAFQKAADEGKPVDPLSIAMLTRMIRNSSNTAATTMLESASRAFSRRSTFSPDTFDSTFTRHRIPRQETASIRAFIAAAPRSTSSSGTTHS